MHWKLHKVIPFPQGMDLEKHEVGKAIHVYHRFHPLHGNLSVTVVAANETAAKAIVSEITK